MKKEVKNILLICVIIYFIYFMFLQNLNENFTSAEMKNYKKTLKENCDKNTRLYNSLTKLNKERCKKTKGRTERETINNNTICYDDTNKEIVSKLDMESNCLMSNMLNNIKEPVLSQVIKPINNKSILEGPEFINQWDTLAFDNKKTNEYSNINLDNSFVVNNRLATF